MAMQRADIDAVRLWCRARVPEELWARQRIECVVTGRHLDLVDVRTGADGAPLRTPFARLRYLGSSRHWSLQWRDADGVFHVYRHLPASEEVAEILAFLESDRDPIFWPQLPTRPAH